MQIVRGIWAEIPSRQKGQACKYLLLPWKGKKSHRLKENCPLSAESLLKWES